MGDPLAGSGSTEGLYGARYLTIVAAAAAVVASLALLARNREAALGAAVLGIYALHLVSVRFLLRNQRRHEESLLAQMDLLHQLADRADSPGATPRRMEGPPERAEGREPVAGAAGPPGSGAAGPPGFGTAGGEVDGSRRDGRRPGAPRASPLDGPAPRRAPLPTRARAAVQVGNAVPAPSNGAPESPAAAESGEIPIPRHFALGTVALIRRLLTPAEVARILMEQRQQPDRRFASLAVEMGLLTDSQREELLLAQQEGLFTEQEMREARERLREFRESTARALSDLG